MPRSLDEKRDIDLWTRHDTPWWFGDNPASGYFPMRTQQKGGPNPGAGEEVCNIFTLKDNQVECWTTHI
jgi:hypothetical protein